MLHAARHQRVVLDAIGDRRLRQPLRRNRADDSVAIAQRHQVLRDAAGHHQAVLDGLVAVAVAQRDLVARHRGHEDHAVRHRGAVGHRVAAMRAEHARAIALVFAHRAGMVEQGAQATHADGQVRAQHVLAVEVEEDASHRRLEERGAALVAGRVPGVFEVQRELHHRRGQRRHHDFEIAADRGRHAATDKSGGVLERPDELVHLAHDVDRDVGRFDALGQQEDRDLVVARADVLDERARAGVILVVAQRPVDQQRMDGRVRGDHGTAVFGRERLDHFDVAALHFGDEGARGASFGRRSAELVVDDERAQGNALDAACDHRESPSLVWRACRARAASPSEERARWRRPACRST